MPRGPKPLTEKALEKAALRYLERYWAPRAHVRRVLKRRIDKAVRDGRAEQQEAMAWVDPLLDRLERNRLIDDEAWARGRIEGLLRRGESLPRIRAKLRQKGVGEALTDQLLGELATGDEIALQAATAYARRRRLGPFRRVEREELREKDLARLARRGFPFDVVRRVIDAPDPDSLPDRFD